MAKKYQKFRLVPKIPKSTKIVKSTKIRKTTKNMENNIKSQQALQNVR